MSAVLKAVGVVSCSFLLCLGLTNVASSADTTSKAIKGKLLRIEGENYVVKNRADGKEVRIHVDNTTIKNAVGFRDGDNIVAEITDQNHVIIILTDQSASTILRDEIIKELKESR